MSIILASFDPCSFFARKLTYFLLLSTFISRCCDYWFLTTLQFLWWIIIQQIITDGAICCTVFFHFHFFHLFSIFQDWCDLSWELLCNTSCLSLTIDVQLLFASEKSATSRSCVVPILCFLLTHSLKNVYTSLSIPLSVSHCVWKRRWTEWGELVYSVC